MLIAYDVRFKTCCVLCQDGTGQVSLSKVPGPERRAWIVPSSAGTRGGACEGLQPSQL